MKHVITLVLGFFAGVIIFVAGLIYNPFMAVRGLSPLSVTDEEVITLSFSNVPSESIVYTNNGESLQQSRLTGTLRLWKAPVRSVSAPYPAKVLQLWEAPIRSTEAMVTVMRDARNQTAGIGIKFSSDSEKSRLLFGEVIADSVWYLYLPEQGAFFIEQTENYWPFVREVAFPAWRSSANNWRGSWLGNMTAGPGALGTAAVSSGSGRIEGLQMNGVESLSVRAYSANIGLVGAEGRLIIEVPGSLNEPVD
ncbi:MAG: hypothetical protein WBM57_08470 [Woeseiaceae bacterium]|jgi:hypothetical protein